MNELQVKTNPQVELVYLRYPDHVQNKMLALRKLVLDTAREIEGVTALEETLKWGEPSFLTKKGSTIRIDWKKKNPEQYAIYFQCSSRLVDTFKTVFNDLFNYEGNRAIVFQLNDDIPEVPLKSCIAVALTYHNVKHLPTLGM